MVPQLNQWVDELQQVRNDFAEGIKPGAYDNFDRILQEMKEFIAREEK